MRCPSQRGVTRQLRDEQPAAANRQLPPVQVEQVVLRVRVAEISLDRIPVLVEDANEVDYFPAPTASVATCINAINSDDFVCSFRHACHCSTPSNACTAL